jgi:uncharacterized membrane protein YgdD (TMEM256/DUF423 family)
VIGMNSGLAGALVAGTGVALGAFGAHALEGRVGAGLIQTWQTGVQYQLVHGLALLLISASGRTDPWSRRAAMAFMVGTVVFSGSLYALVLSGVRLWGAVTPIGGVAFLTGWTLLAVSAARVR